MHYSYCHLSSIYPLESFDLGALTQQMQQRQLVSQRKYAKMQGTTPTRYLCTHMISSMWRFLSDWGLSSLHVVWCSPFSWKIQDHAGRLFYFKCGLCFYCLTFSFPVRISTAEVKDWSNSYMISFGVNLQDVHSTECLTSVCGPLQLSHLFEVLSLRRPPRFCFSQFDSHWSPKERVGMGLSEIWWKAKQNMIYHRFPLKSEIWGISLPYFWTNQEWHPPSLLAFHIGASSSSGKASSAKPSS